MVFFVGGEGREGVAPSILTTISFVNLVNKPKNMLLVLSVKLLLFIEIKRKGKGGENVTVRLKGLDLSPSQNLNAKYSIQNRNFKKVYFSKFFRSLNKYHEN